MNYVFWKEKTGISVLFKGRNGAYAFSETGSVEMGTPVSPLAGNVSTTLGGVSSFSLWEGCGTSLQPKLFVLRPERVTGAGLPALTSTLWGFAERDCTVCREKPIGVFRHAVGCMVASTSRRKQVPRFQARTR